MTPWLFVLKRGKHFLINSWPNTFVPIVILKNKDTGPSHRTQTFASGSFVSRISTDSYLLFPLLWLLCGVSVARLLTLRPHPLTWPVCLLISTGVCLNLPQKLTVQTVTQQRLMEVRCLDLHDLYGIVLENCENCERLCECATTIRNFDFFKNNIFISFTLMKKCIQSFTT